VPLRAVDAVERDRLLRGSLACRRADHQVHDVVAPLSAQSRASSHVRTVPSIVACTLPCTCRPCAASCTLPETHRSGSPSDPTRCERRAWPWRSSQSPSSKARSFRSCTPRVRTVQRPDHLLGLLLLLPLNFCFLAFLSLLDLAQPASAAIVAVSVVASSAQRSIPRNV
jgi:hypothetical protein